MGGLVGLELIIIICRFEFFFKKLSSIISDLIIQKNVYEILVFSKLNKKFSLPNNKAKYFAAPSILICKARIYLL